MTAQQFKDTLAALNLTRYAAGAALGISRVQVYRIAAGKTPVPGPIRRLLECYSIHGLPDSPKQ